MAAIIEASLLAAARRGNCANLAASSQGSTPSRASTESTLSGASSLFFSIRANRKLSNSSVRLETEAEFVISFTGFRTLDQALGSAERRGNLIYCAAAFRARPGNYLRCGISKRALTSSPSRTQKFILLTKLATHSVPSLFCRVGTSRGAILNDAETSEYRNLHHVQDECEASRRSKCARDYQGRQRRHGDAADGQY